MSELLSRYADDYSTARTLFRSTASDQGLTLEAILHPERGADGEELALDAAIGGDSNASRLLIISSGLHGVEGRVGSACQVDLLQGELLSLAQRHGWRLLLLHGLNPFGFSHDRRWDEGNIDPNRNFLLTNDHPTKISSVYRQLNGFLNPPRPPAWHDSLTFRLSAAAAIARHGFSAVKQAVAEGQFGVPRGLFYGGESPCWTHQILDDRMPAWIDACRSVRHIDIHSGLGEWAQCRLLIDYPLREWQRDWMEARMDADQWEAVTSAGDAYNACGALGRWCDHHFFDHEYLYLCAEFGTHRPQRVLRALRRENQAWHYGQRTTGTLAELREMFCPRSPRWRQSAIEAMRDVVARTLSD